MRLREHTKQNDAHSILPLPDKTFSNARECMNGSTPSTGLVTVQLALRVCKAPVHLYGFYPHCCYDEGWARPWWQGLNYKYFHTNSSGDNTPCLGPSRPRRASASGRGHHGVEHAHRPPLTRAAALPTRLVSTRPPIFTLRRMDLLHKRQGGHGERAALLWEDGGQGIGKGASAQAASSRGQRFQRGLRLSSGCQPDAMCGVPGSWPPVSWPAELSIR